MAAGEALNNDQFYQQREHKSLEQSAGVAEGWGYHPLSKYGTDKPVDIALGIHEKAGQAHAAMSGPSPQESMASMRNVMAAGHAVGSARMAATSAAPVSMPQEGEEEEEEG